MKNYNDLDAKGKFIRSVICVPVFLLILILCGVFFAKFFTLSGSWIVKYAIVAAITVALSVYQLASTYIAWKRDEDQYY